MTERPRTIRTAGALADAGLVTTDAVTAVEAVAQRYAISLTPTMRQRIAGGPDDPVALQFVPRAEELDTADDELTDPIGDAAFTPVPGITHRYRDRVLLKPLHVCPVYCRFCFRREAVGPGQGLLSDTDLQGAYAYVRAHPEIWEVILTGGDPLILSPDRLRAIVTTLAGIEHVGVVRVHTRVPVVAPERITDDLVDALSADTPVWIVVHCNHRQELGPDAADALRRLSRGGIPLLSQTVLLKGVNDSAGVLEELFRALVRLRVKPYYLHQADLAPGTGHFRTTIAAGQELVRQLRGPVSGLCQPTYVLDLPGGHGKVPIAASQLARDADGYLVTAPDGTVHRYAPRHVMATTAPAGAGT
ncbi:lysine-2,3-aminomutase-like protein [Dactylosporangium aurantiacum]|uniref:Lysine-2,3-aminomutase-like protein n=1 Tax=Dactylosporangium aurantiacum TaxID=35754 RepID=A0A9Q9IB04_9ACTN|nr:lysine-2,3-aminomutase-like protein [Dactylosporangium aurantiacum]MDG6106948.1 lysine-2,3-aminomutase-like protein [Dactylosporangium aurantiacum]UWZ50692.1 lysine-2,3-aminomutase-like protein [Dactylosporangium aurantiacum]